jgi:hypothetical protein
VNAGSEGDRFAEVLAVLRGTAAGAAEVAGLSHEAADPFEGVPLPDHAAQVVDLSAVLAASAVVRGFLEHDEVLAAGGG